MNVMANDTMEIIAVVRAMLNMFVTVRKPSSPIVSEKNTMTAAKKM